MVKNNKSVSKEDKRAAALRDNLRRRKEQSKDTPAPISDNEISTSTNNKDAEAKNE